MSDEIAKLVEFAGPECLTPGLIFPGEDKEYQLLGPVKNGELDDQGKPLDNKHQNLFWVQESGTGRKVIFCQDHWPATLNVRQGSKFERVLPTPPNA